MPRTVAELPKGTRITDLVSLGVIHNAFPLEKVRSVLVETGRASRRQRDLPAHVMVYYGIALALYMQVSCREVLRCLLEGLRWLKVPGGEKRTTGKSGISQARRRLGAEPMRRLHDELVRPIAEKRTKGAWYRRWKLASLDGSTLDVPDTAENEKAFGRPKVSRGRSAFPQIRFVTLVENGTHVFFGTRMGPHRVGEATLAREVVRSLRPGMLCLADRCFLGGALWREACATGADLLWRSKANRRLPCDRRLPDGSYLSRVYPSEQHRRRNADAATVRVIEYRLEGVPDAEPFYRVATTILDPEAAPAEELAALYHERWEVETGLDELKTHLRGARIVLRSRTPELVRQEFYGFLMAHFAIRGLMHEAALKADIDADRLSYVHAVRVIRRKLPFAASISPSGPPGVPRTGAGRTAGGTRRLEPRAAGSARGQAQDEPLSRQALPSAPRSLS